MAIFIGSSLPMPETRPVDFPIAPDKIAHGFAYGLLAALGVRAVWRPGRSAWRVVVVVLGAIAFGALMEGWQALLGTRGCEFGDGVANAVGASVGGLLTARALVEYSTPRSRKEQTGDGQGRTPQAD